MLVQRFKDSANHQIISELYRPCNFSTSFQKSLIRIVWFNQASIFQSKYFYKTAWQSFFLMKFVLMIENNSMKLLFFSNHSTHFSSPFRLWSFVKQICEPVDLVEFLNVCQELYAFVIYLCELFKSFQGEIGSIQNFCHVTEIFSHYENYLYKKSSSLASRYFKLLKVFSLEKQEEKWDTK